MQTRKSRKNMEDVNATLKNLAALVVLDTHRAHAVFTSTDHTQHPTAKVWCCSDPAPVETQLCRQEESKPLPKSDANVLKGNRFLSDLKIKEIIVLKTRKC